jgi:hypothetical protein
VWTVAKITVSCPIVDLKGQGYGTVPTAKPDAFSVAQEQAFDIPERNVQEIFGSQFHFPRTESKEHFLRNRFLPGYRQMVFSYFGRVRVASGRCPEKRLLARALGHSAP